VHCEAINKLSDLTECNQSNANEKSTDVKATLTPAFCKILEDGSWGRKRVRAPPG